VAADTESLTIAALGTVTVVTGTICQANRDVTEDNLDRSLTSAEVAGFTGSPVVLLSARKEIDNVLMDRTGGGTERPGAHCARAGGLPVRRRSTDLADLLPPGGRQLRPHRRHQQRGLPAGR